MSTKSKQTTNTNQQQSVVSTPTNPAWVDNGLAGLGGQVSNLSNADPYSFVAGADPLQTQAAKSAGGLSTSPNYGQASSIYSGISGAGPNTYAPSTATSASLLDGLQNYMNPYTNDVVNTTLAGFDTSANRTRAQQNLDLAGDSTFGGSGGAITKSMTEQNLAQTRAQTEAQLRDQAFNTGAGLSNSDATRRQDTSLANMAALNQAGQFNANQQDSAQARQLAAAQGLAGVANDQGASDRANVATQSSIGQMLQQLAQAKASAPVSLLASQTGMYSQLPLTLVHGGTTAGTTTGTSTASGSQWGLSGEDFAKVAAAAIAASDIRLKRDIVKLGERADGLGVYLYRYLWSPIQYIGVMAQEVLKVKPEAVLTMPNGFYAVDYGKL